MEHNVFRTPTFCQIVFKMTFICQCNLLFDCQKNPSFFASLYLALICFSHVCCRSHDRGMFAKVFLGRQDGRYDSNSDNLNINQLISLNKKIFDHLLNDDLEREDDQVVFSHRIFHRGDTGPFKMEIDPKNALLLNATAKKILAQMISILSVTPAPVSIKINASRVEKSCTKICQNSGACVANIDTEACFCLTGFRGEFCEFFDDCNRAPGCGSSASCINDGGHLRCRCQDGYYLSEKGCKAGGQCREVTCQNGGTCLAHQVSEKLDSPKEFSCRCKLGFRGEFCEQVIPDCDQNPCKPDQVCIATPTGSYCRSQKAVVRHRHDSFQLSWAVLLWVLIPLTSFIMAPIVVSKILQWKRSRTQREKKKVKTATKVGNNRLKDGKVWFQSSPEKNRHSDQHALLLDQSSEDDEGIQDGAVQII